MAITLVSNAPRYKALITITAGTPIPIESGPVAIKVDRLQIIMMPGGAGGGKVYDDVVPNTAPAAIAASCGTPVPLGPALADGITPGGEYEDSAASDIYGFIDLRTIAVDGTNTGDQVLVNAHLKT